MEIYDPYRRDRENLKHCVPHFPPKIRLAPPPPDKFFKDSIKHLEEKELALKLEREAKEIER